MVNISLKNKTAVITGASQGIGKAIAEVFSMAGANLILLSRNEEKLKILSDKLQCKYLICDVSSEESIVSVFNQINSLDILVNNAGICILEKAIETSTDDVKKTLDVNLKGTINCTKYAVPKINNNGRIINISSIAGKVGYSFFSAYSASKFGMIGFTQSMSCELAYKQITSNCICPGWTETDMAEANLNDPKYSELTGMPLDKLKEYSLAAVPTGKYIQPDEVANLTLFIASDFAAAINGQAITIDGGIVMS